MNLVQLSTNVASQGANTVLLAHGVPGGAVVTQTVLNELLQVQDQQTEAIKRIEGAVDRLIVEPWITARLLLTEAAQPGRTRDDVLAKLAAAADKLREAVAQQADMSFAKAHACLDMALVLKLLGDESGASFYARKAVPAAGGYLETWVATNHRLDPRQWLNADRSTAPWTRETLLSAESIRSDPVLVWTDVEVGTDGDAASRSAATHERDETAELLGDIRDHERATVLLGELVTNSGRRVGPWLPKRDDVLDFFMPRSARLVEAVPRAIVRGLLMSQWRQQRLHERKLGLRILRESENPAAVNEFLNIRNAADRLGGLDGEVGPWLVSSLPPDLAFIARASRRGPGLRN
jgi:hypothetical protein